MIYLENCNITRETPANCTKAARLFAQACEAGSPEGCASLGGMYARARGVPWDPPWDLTKAAQLYERACDAGSLDGCFDAAVAFERGKGVTAGAARAVSLYAKACKLGSGEGCYAVGSALEAGQGVEKDESRAARLYEKACAGGENDGCYRLGICYRNGLGVARDEKRAVRILAAACSKGAGDACDVLTLEDAPGYDASQGLAPAGMTDDRARAVVAIHVLHHTPRNTCVEVYVPKTDNPWFAPAGPELVALLRKRFPKYGVYGKSGCSGGPVVLYVTEVHWSRGQAMLGAGDLAVGTEGRPGYCVKKNRFGQWRARLCAPAE